MELTFVRSGERPKDLSSSNKRGTSMNKFLQNSAPND